MEQYLVDNFNPEMLLLARRSAGMPQSKLNEVTGIPQGSLSKYEAGLLRPSEDNLQKLVNALGFSPEFFAQPSSIVPPVTALHRKQARLGVKDQERLESGSNIQRMHLGSLYAESPWPILLERMIGATPETAAQKIRAQFGVTTGPVRDLTAKVESLGVVVIYRDFGNLPIDGYAMVCDKEGDLPMIFLNANRPGDRLRLNLAHELGHLVLHETTVENVEDEAWAFAAELLMPSEELEPAFKEDRMNLGLYQRLKRIWLVSMAALIRRAYKLGVLAESQYRTLLMKMAPFRKVEPVRVDPEPAAFVKTIFGRMVTTLGFEGVLRKLAISRSKFDELYAIALN